LVEADDAVVLDDDAVAAAVLADDALVVDDELDPHPTITAAIMATATTPAPMRARSDLNMGPLLLLSRPARLPIRVDLRPAWEANRFDQLAASPSRWKTSQFGS
jgi:hypothetical protein